MTTRRPVRLQPGQSSTLALGHKLGPDGVALNAFCCFAAVGALDRSAAQVATRFVGERHVLLSSTFDTAWAYPVGAPPLVWRPVADEEVDRELGALALARFDFDREPALRVAVFQTPTRALLLFVSHAVASDRRSMAIIAADWAAAYRQDSPDLPDATGAYLNHAPRPVIDEADRAFWMDRLDRLGTPSVDDAYHWEFGDRVRASSALPAAELAQTAARLRVSPFALLLAAVAVTLGRSDQHVMFSVEGRRGRVQQTEVGPFSGASLVWVAGAGDGLAAAADAAKRDLLTVMGHQRLRLDEVLGLPDVELAEGARLALGELVMDYRTPVAAVDLGASGIAEEYAIDWTAYEDSKPRTLVLGLDYAIEHRGPAVEFALSFNPYRFTRERAQELVDAVPQALAKEA